MSARVVVLCVTTALGAALAGCSSGSNPSSHETTKLPPTPQRPLTFAQTCRATAALVREGNMTPGQMRAQVQALASRGDRASKRALADLIIALDDHTDGSAGVVGGVVLHLRQQCDAIDSWPDPAK